MDFIQGVLWGLVILIVGGVCYRSGVTAGREGYRKLTDKELEKRRSDWAEEENEIIYQMHDFQKDNRNNQ